MFTESELKQRQSGIGASESAAALGLSRYATPMDVYLSKVREVKASVDNAATKRGRLLEPVVLSLYEDEYGKIERNLPRINSSEFPFMFASLDARRMDDKRPVEAKTVGLRSLKDWGDGDDNIPQEYLVQITHQCIVTSQPVGDVAAFSALDELRRYIIEKDIEFAEMIVEGLKIFWRRVENREPPPLTAADPVEKFFPRSRDAAIEATPEVKLAYAQLLETRAAIKPFTAREESLKHDIQLFMADRDTLLVDGERAINWKTAKSSKRFDATRFKADHPDLYAQYLIEGSPSRRFLVKGEKND